jgi:uncharacterized protein
VAQTARRSRTTNGSGAPPPLSAAKDESTPRPQLKIPYEALLRARRKPQQQLANDESSVERFADAIRPYVPHPNVVPKTGPRLAMDDATLSWFETSASWAGAAIAAQTEELLRFPGFPYLSELALRGEYRRISEIIATEMTREWITFRGVGDEADKKEDRIKRLDDAQKRFKLQEHFRKVFGYDGLFGRGQLFVDLADDKGESLRNDRIEISKSIGTGRDEVSKAKVKKGSLLGFRPIEPMWTYPYNYNSIDPLAADWYKPNIWFVMGKQVHETRLLTVVLRPVPDLFKPAFAFAGLSLSQIAKPYIDNFLRTRQSVSDLIHSFSTNVLSTDMGSSLGIEGETLFNRVDFFLALRDNRNCMVINKDSEEFNNVSTPISGLSELQAQSQEQICSISGLPLIKYTGLTPSGLNASSEGELRSFYDWIMALLEYMRPLIQTALDFIQLSEFGDIDEEIIFDFKPLWQLDEAGQSANQQIKAAIHEVYSGLGVVSPEEIRTALTADPESPYATLELDPEDLPEPPMPAMGGEVPGAPGEPGAEGKKPNGAAGGAQSGGEGRTVGRESITAGGGGRPGAASGV